MNFKKLLSSITLATGAALAPVVAEASTFQDHIRLAQAVQATGTQVKINPKDCAKEKSFGWYWAAGRELVVCQENGYGGGPEVAWTSEDLDTLRHEAHHLVQDCRDGRLDGSLLAVYKDPIAVGTEVLGYEYMNQIAEGYGEKGPHIVVMEIEAFSVALLDDPQEQIADIQRYCF